MRRGLKLAFCIACFTLGVVVAWLGVRSIYVRDMFTLRERASGNEYDGSSGESWIYSTRGSIRLNITTSRWHYAHNPNPFPRNRGLEWRSMRAMPMQPVPGWHESNRAGVKAASRGFDVMGFGAGHF